MLLAVLLSFDMFQPRLWRCRDNLACLVGAVSDQRVFGGVTPRVGMGTIRFIKPYCGNLTVGAERFNK